ncbi:MAG: hypothetical protein ACTS27_01390 [Phycisphaerales bacterium]
MSPAESTGEPSSTHAHHEATIPTMTNASTLESIREQAEGTLDGPAPKRPATPPGAATTVCPYCGNREQANAEQCSSCKGLFEPLSKIATQNAMGPWQIRDEMSPFRPGCSIETLRALIRRGKLTRESVIRGPSTKQFWRRAADAQGVSHLLGVCHACAGPASADHHHCRSCGASFLVEADRDRMGLDPVRPLPATAPAARAQDASIHADAEPKPSTTAHAPAHAAPQPAPAGFLDVFSAPPATAPAERGAPSTSALRAELRTSRRGSRAVRHAVAAATVALCAAALSVAVWAASAAGVAEQPDAAPVASEEPAAESVVAAAESSQAAPVPPAAPTEADLAEWGRRIDEAVALGAADDAESLKAAIQALREIQRTAPEGVLPADFGATVEALERRLDDLTVERFLNRAQPGR